MKSLKEIKRIISIILTLTMLAMQYTTAFAYNVELIDYIAIHANKYSIDKRAEINGSIIKGGVEDYSSAIFYLFSGNDVVKDEINIEENSILETPIYCKNKVEININKFINNAMLGSHNSIGIKSEKLESEEIAIIYSNKGDITIDCNDIEFSGIIYAPNGKVTIKSKNVLINGCIIADSIKINSKNTEISPNEESEGLLTFLKGYKNEGYMEFHAYIEDGDLGVNCDSNLNMAEGTIYVRYDNDNYFQNIGNFETNQGIIEDFEFDNQIDVIVEGRSVFGEKIESDVITLQKDAEGQIKYIKQDTDNDGMEDGIEIFYLGSNPEMSDTDGDNISDGIEAYNIYTNPVKKDKSSDDFDNDGVTNYDEIKGNTDVFLADTDFDGVKDKNDKKSREYSKDSKVKEIQSITQGRFDKIITYIDEEGNCVQKVYDFINRKVKMEKEGDLIKSYYYDYEMNLSSKITSYNDEVIVNNYEYDGENLVGIYNNGYKYEFYYDDDTRITEVKLNDISLIRHNYLENGKTTVYANGSYSEKEFAGNHTTFNTGENDGYTYEYDTEKNADTYEFENGLILSYSYDEAGELKGVETNTDFSIGYDKVENESGSVTDITYTICGDEYKQVDTLKYDEEIGKSISSELISGSEFTKYYDEDNGLVEKLNVDGREYKNHIIYGENSKVELINYNDGSSVSYTYDNDDNITMVKENDQVVTEYQYDLLDRLIVEIDYKNSTISKYTYDLYGNIKSSEKYDYKNGEIGELISSDSYVYSKVYGDQLVEFNGNTITYDESGKPLEYYNGSKFKWNGDKLVQAVVGEKTIEFEQDNNGTVTRKSINGTDTVYCVEGTDYIAETTNGKTIIYMYDLEANILGFTYEGKEYYYVKNGLNDVTKIVNSDNEFVCSYTYDAWGNITEIAGDKEIAEINKYRYRSYYYDVDLKMYYLHSRYYDTTTGRFISTDNLDMMIYNEDNLNLYAYCKNNPVYYVDPEGTTATLVVFSLTDWKYESNKIIEDFEEYFGKNSISSKLHLSNNMNKFEDVWNNLSYTRYVVINTHGCSSQIGLNKSEEKDSYTLTTDEIDKLDFKYIDILILLGCNSGHYDYKLTNVASAFSKRITGCVVAGDGSVKIGKFSTIIGSVKFESLNDKYFVEEGTSKRDNEGWIVYKYGRKNNKQYSFTGILGKTVTVKSIIDCIIDNYFFSSYK